jgi:NAD(P)-dependent dehydrogenase (short-subunit alcohol dehydrogenase family)
MSALAGRVALVTGGAQGIGLTIAKRLIADGVSVVIADPMTSIAGDGADPAATRQVADEIGATAFVDSVASPSAAAAAVELAVKHHGGLDIVINNAAILRDGFLFKLDPASWQAVLNTNLSAAAYVLAAAAPVLREQAKAERGGKPYAWGRIVNIVSTAGLYGNYGQAAYAAAKAGLVALTRVSALDMARSGVTANAIAPFAATRVTDSIKPANDAQAAYKAKAMAVPTAPVAALAAWLCSPAAQQISGQILGVRGREVMIFNQARPAARVVATSATIGADELVAAFAPDGAFARVATKLESDLEAFSGDPIL